MRIRFASLVLFILPFMWGYAQPSNPDWHLDDPEKNLVQGISLDRAYERLRGKPSTTVVVAIIDSGIDIEHEDLKAVLWTNVKEIAGNGVDDDKNGYVDDIHGWSFIGGPGGDVNEDTYELTREFIRLDKKYGHLAEKNIPGKDKKEYASYLKIKDKFIRLRDKNREEYGYYLKLKRNLDLSLDTLKATLKSDMLTWKKIDSLESHTPTQSFAKGIARMLLQDSDANTDLLKIKAEVDEAVEHYRVIVECGYNVDFDTRKVVGDNAANPREKFYGSSNVKGPDPDHGTHVAGIVAADRTNGTGINGIADKVRIMVLRAVPNGDERDKDIANAIRYAVDNGAKVINMSFGKSLSPDKAVVDEAVAYAEQKGVLIVHGAGNENTDNDKKENFPNPNYLNGKKAVNWLEVGATAAGTGKDFVADFSNYGKKSVDVFAPGVDIYSTLPGNTYKEQSGTSMASPVVTGIAALLWSYFPDLTAAQVVDVIKNSTRKFDRLKVNRPGGGETEFSELSSSGGLVNAYYAVNLALSIQSKPGGKK